MAAVRGWETRLEVGESVLGRDCGGVDQRRDW